MGYSQPYKLAKYSAWQNKVFGKLKTSFEKKIPFLLLWDVGLHYRRLIWSEKFKNSLVSETYLQMAFRVKNSLVPSQESCSIIIAVQRYMELLCNYWQLPFTFLFINEMTSFLFYYSFLFKIWIILGLKIFNRIWVTTFHDIWFA